MVELSNGRDATKTGDDTVELVKTFTENIVLTRDQLLADKARLTAEMADIDTMLNLLK